uniref:Uncharacterized protein n=1 Tax=Boodleopsis pusilla TaxID=381415 RepID=A0A386AZJ0_9CHLO|nr:hypothetical protein [Boodleopsis pusilla]AYC64859.1 hypothetical protein [Boodleopsis pusilla]
MKLLWTLTLYWREGNYPLPYTLFILWLNLLMKLCTIEMEKKDKQNFCPYFLTKTLGWGWMLLIGGSVHGLQRNFGHHQQHQESRQSLGSIEIVVKTVSLNVLPMFLQMNLLLQQSFLKTYADPN